MLALVSGFVLLFKWVAVVLLPYNKMRNFTSAKALMFTLQQIHQVT